MSRPLPSFTAPLPPRRLRPHSRRPLTVTPFQPPSIRLFYTRRAAHVPTPLCCTPPTSPPPPPPPTPSPADAKLTFWFTAVSQLAAALCAVPLCWLVGVPPLGRGYALTAPHVANSVLLAVPFSVFFWALQRVPTGIEAATDAMFRGLFAARGVEEVAVFCGCVALGEELLFRGWLLAGLERGSVGAGVALVVSSLVFGVLHAYTRVYMVLASVAGVMFGGLFLMAGESVLEPIVVHFLYDFCTILAMQRRWLAVDHEP